VTFERSRGKARPTLPRSSELRAIESARDPSDGRGVAGRFAPGNQISVRQGQKHAVKKLLGKDAGDSDATAVARDALRLLYAATRTSPDDGPVPRSLWALYARHLAVSAFYSARADEAGLDTERGMLLADKAAMHAQRGERLAVTAYDIASKLAAAEPGKTLPALSALQSSIIAERHARRSQAARDASDGPRADPTPKDAPESILAQERPISEDEPPRAIRVHEGEDDRPVRIAAKVQKEADARDIERAFGTALSLAEERVFGKRFPKTTA
jgi:hypothetical protein